jgi:hypothetical protein
MNNTPKVLKSQKPSITIKAAKRNAASTIDWADTLSELIDNAILVDKNKCVEVIVNMHCDNDEEKSFIQVVDNSIGIPERDFLDVFNYGTSANIGKMLLGKMGMGLKGAVWGLGELDYAISKTSNGNKCEVRPRPYDSDEEELVYEQVECTSSLLDAQKHGTCIRIKRVNDTLPMWSNKKHFDKVVEKFNSMYAILLHENRVNIKFYYSNSNGNKFDATCGGSFPLMSNPRHILNSNPEINIGHNEPTYKEGTLEKIEKIEIKTANTKVYVTAWHKPTPTQVEKHYEVTKDAKYDPVKYKNSVFGYGAARAGMCVLYKGKFVQLGLERASSRESDKGIIIEIPEDCGLKFTQYKNTFVQDVNYRECLDAVNAFLESNGFMIRSISGTPQVSEDEIVLKFVEFIRNDPIYSQSFGIVNFNEQVKTWVASEVGEADIVIYDYYNKDKVNVLIEAKKDRCGAEEARQLWGYMCEFGCDRGILLTGTTEQPTFRAQIQAFKRHHNGLSMETANVNSLTSSKFFT